MWEWAIKTQALKMEPLADHAHELRRSAEKVGRPSGDVPAVMHQAAAYIEDLERRLREAEARVAELEAERAELERQEAAGYISDDALRDLQAREPGAPPVFPMSSDRNYIPLYAATPITKEYPVFWYRPHSDGLGYDGPIHDSQIEQVRRESGAWVPLIARPIQPARGEG